MTNPDQILIDIIENCEDNIRNWNFSIKVLGTPLEKYDSTFTHEINDLGSSISMAKTLQKKLFSIPSKSALAQPMALSLNFLSCNTQNSSDTQAKWAIFYGAVTYLFRERAIMSSSQIRKC